MDATKEAMTYDVAPNGQVSTTGQFIVISDQDWNLAREVLPDRYGMYHRLFAALERGENIAMPGLTLKRAYYVRSTIRKKARHMGIPLEDKIVKSADGQELCEYLLRRQHD
jgi:hypothetical protein